MSPFTMSLLTGGIFFAADKLLGKRGNKPPGLPEPPEFTQAQISKFTHPDPETRARRYFDADVLDNVVLPALTRRSAVPLDHPDLSRIGRVWAVVALQPGQLRASEVVERAGAEGQAVVGSLSLVLVDNGADDVMLLVVGEPGIERYARNVPRSPFAIVAPRLQGDAGVVAKMQDAKNGAVPLIDELERAGAVGVKTAAAIKRNGAKPRPVDAGDAEALPPISPDAKAEE